jgi:membrane-bound serine protease (ClpP class)
VAITGLLGSATASLPSGSAWPPWVLPARAEPEPQTKPEPSAPAQPQENASPPAKDAPGGNKPAPGHYRPDPSPHANAAKRELKLGTPRGAKVLRIPINGTIDLGQAAFIERALREHADAALVVLDINTLGGRVDAAIRIRDAMLGHKKRTAAFINPRAISAGALIALSCDVIGMTRGASFGAVTPMSGDGTTQSEAVEEKMTSYMRAEMRSTAEAKGRRGDIAEAMVDRNIEIEGIDAAGKLLTLDTDKALTLAMADLQADSVSGMLTALGLEAPKLRTVTENWAERIARFLTDPTVSGLLMSLGMLGLLIELYSPGVGLPGALGVICLSLFFGGHMITHLAGLEEILLLLVGLALLALEVFVLPGFGIAGVAGLAFVGTSLVLTLLTLPLDLAWSLGLVGDAIERVGLSLIFTIVFAVIAARFLPRTRAGQRLILAGATDVGAGYVSAPIEIGLIGEAGVAATDLRPAGKADVAGRRHDVVSEGEYIERGSRVVVVQASAGRLVVRRSA